MQTFLPYPDYLESMRCLDDRRLGNQVYREGKTLLSGGWRNHPASKMWQGHMHHLALYCMAGLKALEERGRYYPNHYAFFLSMLMEHENTGQPSWLGDHDFHASHRSNLLRKDPEWYGQFGWNEPDNLPYVWPVV